MSEPERFEILVLGCGNGGMYLAWHMARSGRRTAVVERRWIGGSCPNINCLPSKNVIWSAKVAHLVHQGLNFGIAAKAGAVDMSKVRQRKRDMVEGLKAATLREYRLSGAELIMGTGHFVAPKTLEVALNSGGTRLLEGEQVIINVGTHAVIPDIPGLRESKPLTNIEALELNTLPPHLIVIGGGYAGLELAQAFRRFGSEVTVLEQGPQIAGREDPDVANELHQILSGEGINILVNTQLRRVTGESGTRVSLDVAGPSGERTIEGSDILAAAGRAPNTAGIGLEVTGAELNSRGYIKVGSRLQTAAPGVWAIGECAGSPQFTHVSFDDFRVIRDNLAGLNRTTDGRLIPYCMFTDPQLAHVGLSGEEAQRQGIEVRVAILPMNAVLRTHTTGETQGFMKALIAQDDDRILGFTMIGAEAGEVVAVVQAAMLAGMPYTGLRDAILAHPTVAEGLDTLFSKVPSRLRERAALT
jgi:pyruvate/2-oxoglutarate dehydrogenase complex dihydrolipoamide dehydrogenase (E3) component